MKKFYALVTLLCLVFTYAKCQIVISEIMYNPPESGNDSLEYIELYNLTNSNVNLNGYSFSQGVVFTFPDTSIAPTGFLVVAVNAGAFNNVFGFNPLQWETGALSNGGEDIILIDPNGNEVAIVDYTPNTPWPTFSDGTNGGGSSIEFCIDEMDNNDALNWRASTASTGIIINQFEVKGTPGSENSVSCGIIADATVILSGFVFSPADITINVGETVLWINQSGTHNVNGSLETFPNNPEGFFSGNPKADPFEFSFQFTKPGFYNYQCDPHMDLGMVGTITVIGEFPKLVFTEILYNHPSLESSESLEFVEVYNAGESEVNLGGMKFKGNSIDYTLEDAILPAGEFLILQKQTSSYFNEMDLTIMQWSTGDLDDDSDAISLLTKDGEIIDLVVYGNAAPWDSNANGTGRSLSLCNFNGDNEDASNWQASSSIMDFSFGDGVSLFANPGAFNACSWDIATATEVDENGVSILNGNKVILQGFVYGNNLRTGGLQFTLIDDLNEGIGVFSNTEEFGYTVTEGDELIVAGTLDQFNGFIQIYIDTLQLISSGNTLIESDTITILGETSESSLVTIKNVKLTNPSQWSNTNSSSGFNVTVTNGSESFELRIDAEVEELFNGRAPDGTFNVTGIGGQYDVSSPYTSGYQLLPRYAADINPYIPIENLYPLKTITEVSQIDQNGEGTANEMKCEVVGTVYGINFRPAGLQFTLISETNDGIGLFLSSGNLGYEFAEGDEISVKGTMNQFNGLIQIIPDSIKLLSSGNSLFDPTPVAILDENSESQLIKIQGTVTNPGQWTGNGSSFNIEILTPEGERLSVRIDSDTELASMPLPGTILNITGLGSQFDNSLPYDSGYEMYPRYAADIEMASGTKDNLEASEFVKIYPNPVHHLLQIESNIVVENVKIFNNIGQLVISKRNLKNLVDVSGLEKGLYFVQLITKEGLVTKEIIKQ